MTQPAANENVRTTPDARGRDYDAIARAVRERLGPDASRAERMQVVVDALWEGLADHAVSWVGFYLHDPQALGASPDQPLILGPRRDKPACSPIGLHGVCGQSFTTRATRIVRDVAELGDNYVACDPRDRSEIVLPLPDETDASDAPRCWGVLDLDSFDVGAFTEADEQGLKKVLAAAALRTL